jgi:hypothetical protein
MKAGPFMLPAKSQYYLPGTIHCPLDHLRMKFQASVNAYRCNLGGCPAAYAPDKGYYRIQEAGNATAREAFYGQAAICLCENDDVHPLYIQDYSASRKVRFWVCPVRGCGYEVSQRLEKTAEGWRTCGSFEHQAPVRIRR